jgi:biopolymer transport protein ExbD
MATGRRGGPVALPNMTPMIDVLLVLLIIFMVVQQGLQRGVAVQVPPADPDLTTGPEALVLEVGPGGTYRLNSQPVPAASLGATLAGVFAPRARKVLFVKGEEGAAYAEVVHAVDVSRSAGVEVVGLVPRAQAH